jgi:hypothetical protein
MNDAERRKLLFEKVTANKQRRERDELLDRLPPHLSGVIGGSPCTYSVQIDSILRRFLPFNQTGLGSSGMVPPHYGYAEVAWENQVIALLPRLVVPRLAGKAFLLLKSPEEVHFEGHGYYLPDVPLFTVEFRWAVAHLKDLWDNGEGCLFLVEQDLVAGVLIDTFSGILPKDPNPSEVVYEVALWPDQPDESSD